MVTVGALNYETSPGAYRASFSNYGPEVDVAAPGVGIVSTCSYSFTECRNTGYFAQGYSSWNGTSMATPMISGIAAVVKAVYQGYSAYDLGAAILYTAQDIQYDLMQGTNEDLVGWDRFTGRGIADASAALPATPPTAVSLAAPANGATVTGSTTVSVTVPVPEMVVSVAVYLDSTANVPLATIDVNDWLISVPIPDLHATPSFTFTWTPTSIGSHDLIAVATNLGGLELGTDTVTVNVQQPSGGGGGGGGSGFSDETGDQSTEAEVSSNGGTVKAFEDAVALDFEAGTFDEKIAFVVKKLAEAAKAALTELAPVSPVFEFDTGGAALKKAVTVAVRYDKDKMAAADVRKLGLYRQDDEDPTRWTYAGGRVDPASGVVRARLNHFSRYAVMVYQPTFSDLAGHWARGDVELLAARHVVAGAGAGAFQPERRVTRAELAKMLVEMLAQDPGRTIEKVAPAQATFADVAADTWYYTYVETAARYGLARGDGARFRPDDPVTREELAAMVVRALGLEEAARAPSGTPLAFDDAAAVAPWARGYVAVARDRGLIKGLTATTFAPGEGSTRAQTAAVVLRAMERAGWLEVPAVVEGTLTVNDIEGRHYELEATVDGQKRTYVLIPLGDDVARALASNVGRTVRVTGLPHRGADIYMRGTVLHVIEVQVTGS